jgi:hypothetical protein
VKGKQRQAEVSTCCSKASQRLAISGQQPAVSSLNQGPTLDSQQPPDSVAATPVNAPAVPWPPWHPTTPTHLQAGLQRKHLLD